MPPLNLFILITVAIILLGMFWHNRKRSNRKPEEYRQADSSGGNKPIPRRSRERAD